MTDTSFSRDAMASTGGSLMPRPLGGLRYLAGPQDSRPGRSFGGRLVAEAMGAAAQTVDPAFMPHSAYAQFVAAGEQRSETTYVVEALRDGRSFSRRSVRVEQGGELIAIVLVSAAAEMAGGPSRHDAMADVPRPGDLEDHSVGRDAGGNARLSHLLWPREHPVEIRPVNFPRAEADQPARLSYWFRARPELTDSADLAQRACLIAYVTDRFAMTTPAMAHLSGFATHDFTRASLDHAVWIHRDHQPNGWLLYSIENPTLHGSRAYVRGEVFSEDGSHVASVSQEGLFVVRPRKPQSIASEE